MDTKKVRKIFFDYFKNKNHKIIDSAPITVKDDPTLMFTNAGMNQFKNIFLGYDKPQNDRIANTQKCLRVSGKHNDLEEVGIDKYHHTMFEMLGNWSFGDYFKKDAILWAWDLLTNHYCLDENKLFVTVFGGDKKEKLDKDLESIKIWSQIVDKSKIVDGSKEDNFWEMGDSGPCGPCSEVHIDLRDDAEIKKIPTSKLINKDHPEVIEIWNLVFIEFNRKSDGSLEPLPNKHVDTGMGLERLAMAIRSLKSTYDIDLFYPIIKSLEKISNLKYDSNEKVDIAFRVICDHIRAIVFTISDGAIPSNNKSGYVVRRILRRAVRYGYSSLKLKSPFLYKLVDAVINEYKKVFNNLFDQKDFIKSVIKEEEKTFLKTLENGLKKINEIKKKMSTKNDKISGELAFELYDTYGFPYDLTELIARENNLKINKKRFDKLLSDQRERSRNVPKTISDDWITINDKVDSIFSGYDSLTSNSKILKHRQVNKNGKKVYHLVFDKTPFYSESGGQVGDTGFISSNDEKINVINTFKENDLIIHETQSLPNKFSDSFNLEVNSKRRNLICKNHSATHLLHSTLRNVLGDHVVQKGSLVSDKVLRFDFSHFSKITDVELSKINKVVNEKISENIPVKILLNVPIKEAEKMGAMALFGEKYGDKVRVVIMDNEFSIELCGGTHVNNTSEIGLFKIISESSISSGVRRIEALTSIGSENYTSEESKKLFELKNLLKSGNVLDSVKILIEKNKSLESEITKFDRLRKKSLKDEIKDNVEKLNDSNLILYHFNNESLDFIKQIAFEMDKEIDNLIFLATSNMSNKPLILLLISKEVVKKLNLDAKDIINKLALNIKGAGGGQNFLSTAGGKNIDGLSKVLSDGRDYFKKLLKN